MKTEPTTEDGKLKPSKPQKREQDPWELAFAADSERGLPKPRGQDLIIKAREPDEYEVSRLERTVDLGYFPPESKEELELRTSLRFVKESLRKCQRHTKRK